MLVKDELFADFCYVLYCFQSVVYFIGCCARRNAARNHSSKVQGRWSLSTARRYLRWLSEDLRNVSTFTVDISEKTAVKSPWALSVLYSIVDGLFFTSNVSCLAYLWKSIILERNVSYNYKYVINDKDLDSKSIFSAFQMLSNFEVPNVM